MANLTPEQIAEKARWAALTPAQKGIETKALKAAEKASSKFLNPFNEGVTYADFVNAIPEDQTVAEYCSGELTKDEINWISEEVEHFKGNQKK